MALVKDVHHMLTLMKTLRPTDNIEPDCWVFDLQRREWQRESHRVQSAGPAAHDTPPPAILLGGDPKTFDWSHLEHALRLFQRWEDNERWHGRRRPKARVTLSCTLSPDHAARLDALANDAGLSREAMATALLEKLLNPWR